MTTEQIDAFADEYIKEVSSNCADGPAALEVAKADFKAGFRKALAVLAAS